MYKNVIIHGRSAGMRPNLSVKKVEKNKDGLRIMAQKIARRDAWIIYTNAS